MTFYVVEIWDDDFKEWHPVNMEMCGKRLCEKCKADISHMSHCDYTFKDTEHKWLANNIKKDYEKWGFKVRLRKKGDNPAVQK